MTLSHRLRHIGHRLGQDAVAAKEALQLADLAGRIVIAAALGIETTAIRVVFDRGKGRREPVYARPLTMEEQALVALGGAEAIRRLSGFAAGDEGMVAPLMGFIRLALDQAGRERFALLIAALNASTVMIGTRSPLPPLIPVTVPDAAITARLTALLKEHGHGR